MRLLVVTAVPAERDALLARVPGTAGSPPAADDSPAGTGTPVVAGAEGKLTVAAVGVGMAAAAAGTARLLAQAPAGYDAVLCAGIGGGLAGRAGIGDTVLATDSIAADLGADSPAGFLPLDELGLGPCRHPADPRLLAWLGELLRPDGHGPVLTVATVTGTRAGAEDLARRHPGAVAEGMEGFGAATAATAAGVAFAELRTISNLVGPRDRAAWRIGTALAALSQAGAALAHP